MKQIIIIILRIFDESMIYQLVNLLFNGRPVPNRMGQVKKESLNCFNDVIIKKEKTNYSRSNTFRQC